MLKAIALDMDNTLLNSNKEISVTNRDVLRYLNRKGIRIILCSGRPFATLKPFLDELHVTKNDDVCVCFNGGLVRLVRDHTVIKANTLSKEQIKPVYDLVKENGFKLDIVAEDEVYSLTEFGKSSYQTMIPKQMPFIDTTFSKVPAKLPIFKVVVAGEPAMVDAASDAAQSLKQLTVTRSRRTLLEILPPNVNKMNGLKAALNFYRIPREQLAAFGDEENDKDMLEYAGIGVAMGNAIPGIKQIADITVGSNDDDGVANYLIDYFQINPTAIRL